MSTTGISIAAPNFQIITVGVRGTAAYCQNKMTKTARNKMRDSMLGGRTSSSKKVREPKNFQRDYEETLRVSNDGKYGIPCKAFRQAMTDACRATDMKMTTSKLAFTILADGEDRDDMMPLVYFKKGEPQMREHDVKNANGSADIRARPFWEKGWEADIRINYDADMMQAADVVNLLARAGAQVGVGAGRPFSPNSTGMGWGTFEIITEEEKAEAKPAKKGAKK